MKKLFDRFKNAIAAFQKVPEEPLPEVDKLYVLVRGDLAPGYQIAQAIHAKDEFTHMFPEVELDWRERSNTIIVLNVPCRHSLEKYVSKAMLQYIKCAVFHEPDLEGQATAAAFEHGKAAEKLDELVRVSQNLNRKVG